MHLFGKILLRPSELVFEKPPCPDTAGQMPRTTGGKGEMEVRGGTAVHNEPRR